MSAIPAAAGPPKGADILLVFSVLGAFLAIMGAGLTQDPIFRFQALTVFAAALSRPSA